MKTRKCAVCRQPSAAFLCENPACRDSHNARCREYQRKARARLAAGEVTENFYSRHMATEGRQRKSNSTCVDCGAPVAHGSTEETRCRACGKRRWRERQAEIRRFAQERGLPVGGRRTARALRDRARAAEGVQRGWVFVSGPCHSCGVHFTCQLMNSAAKFCSRTCARREAKAIRRALEAGVKITPGRRHAVFVRDNWTCRICGDPVDRTAKAPELDAPVIDHRIPLARGGAHAPGNWQTAHFYCNSVKCDRLDYDFAEEVS